MHTVALEKLGYDFQFAFYSNYGPVLYHFRDIGRKLRFFSYSSYIRRSNYGVPVGVLA